MSVVPVVLVVAATLLAGALGAVVRARAVALAPRAGMFLVNVSGTAILALVIVAHGREMLDTGLAVVLGIGLSGSLTTFSSWMALLAHGFEDHPIATLLVDLLLPIAVAVARTVVVFAFLS